MSAAKKPTTKRTKEWRRIHELRAALEHIVVFANDGLAALVPEARDAALRDIRKRARGVLESRILVTEANE